MSGSWWRRLRFRDGGAKEVHEPSVPREVVPEEWLVLAPCREVSLRARGWLSGLEAPGRVLFWSAPEELEAPPVPAERVSFGIAVWRDWLSRSDARLRVLILLPAPECVAFAREAAAAGARVIYDKPAPILFAGPERAFHPDDERALVRVAQDLVAADRATTRLLADTSERLRLIHDFAQAEDAGAHLPSVLEKASLAIVVDAAKDRSRLEETIQELREARGLAAYDIAVVIDPEEGAGFAELLGRETAGEISLVRDPRGPSMSGLAMAVRASSTEVLVFLRSGQLPTGTDWLEAGLRAIYGDRQIGALGLAEGAEEAGETERLSRMSFNGMLIRRRVFLRVGGLEERLGDNASAADFSMRLLTSGYRLEQLDAPAILPGVPGGGLSAKEMGELKRRWPEARGLLARVLEAWVG